MLPALYLLLTLAFAGALLLLLWRPGAARAEVVWGLAALLPLLVAVAEALAGQARAARVLAGFGTAPLTVTLVRGGETRSLTLTVRDAACLERALRLHARSELLTAQAPLLLDRETRVVGDLPPQAVVEALSIRGALACPHLRPLREGNR